MIPPPPDRFQELVPFVPPRGAGEPTRTAALRTTARFMKGRYQEILQAIADSPRGGLCIFEVAALLSAKHLTTIHDHQISGRFGTLEDAGLLVKSPATRPTATGCQATVYNVTLAGMAILQEAGATTENTAAQRNGRTDHG
jgi:hypothetical protein